MLTMLKSLSGATAVVPIRRGPVALSGTASLRKVLVCRICGNPLTLSRFVRLAPSGIRGYYSDVRGHIVAIDRSRVTRAIRSDEHRIYFA